tara:strand:+ start:1 stop:954 length:954 start_codon:yes stop_codon:yes gene_type:complete
MVFVVMFLMLVLVLSGCSPVNNYAQLTQRDLRKGSKGLEVKFLKGIPPDTIFENDPSVFMSISVDNVGASDIKNGVLSLGFEQDYLVLDKIIMDDKEYEVNAPIVFDMEGKSLDNPYGGQTFLEIDSHSKDISLSKFQDTVVMATACYDYQTILGESVCIDPIQSRTQMHTKACQSSDFSPSSQGAPVNVQSVSIQSKKVTDDKVRTIFRIKINNNGNGKVVAKGISSKLCSSASLREIPNFDYRRVLDMLKVNVKLGEDIVKCKNDGVVKLENGKSGEAICEIDTPLRGEYVTSFVVQLDYGYTFTVQRKLKIEKI